MAVRVLSRLRQHQVASSQLLESEGVKNFVPFTTTTTAFSDSKTVPGLNIKKSGSDPELKEDSAYPDWLWALPNRGVSLYELGKQDEEDLNFPQLARKLKLTNRMDIKEKNMSKAKR
ncbi:hypothetical protein WJX74_010821 [Apatococcus lobatus]|uniref:Large ribosomal subunit protein mL54 n=1 Tax=Apatococcus lobatus TaxID=904363 RepID=A0AAW1RIX6_9CHLO